MTDFDTRLDGGGFGDNFQYGPAHPTISLDKSKRDHTKDCDRKNEK